VLFRTLTAPVDFEECIRALKDYAFVKSSYPVIITFEDHLTASLQAEAAKVEHTYFHVHLEQLDYSLKFNQYSKGTNYVCRNKMGVIGRRLFLNTM
jgi:hypothetical protein